VRLATVVTLLLAMTASFGRPACCVMGDCCVVAAAVETKRETEKTCSCCAPERAPEPAKPAPCDCDDHQIDHSTPPHGTEFEHPLALVGLLEIGAPVATIFSVATVGEHVEPPRAFDEALNLPLLL